MFTAVIGSYVATYTAASLLLGGQVTPDNPTIISAIIGVFGSIIVAIIGYWATKRRQNVEPLVELLAEAEREIADLKTQLAKKDGDAE